MAKIHVRGGSPLRLEFENDEGKTLKVHLEEVSKGKDEYWVINEATGKKIQTHQEGGQNIFRETNPHKHTCEISYMEQARTFV